MHSILTRWVRWLLRWSGLVLIFYVGIAAVSTFYTVRLYKNLRTDFQELLPSEARSVIDLKKVENTMESSANLGVLVFSDHPDASRRFVTDFSNRVQQLKPLVSRVEYRINREIDFFTKRRALMMDTDDLKNLDQYIGKRLSYEREIRNPLNLLVEKNLTEPVLDQDLLNGKYESRISDYTRFKDGYYATPDEKIRAVLIYLSGGALNTDTASQLKSGVDRIISQLNPSHYDPSMQIKFTGDVENLLEERASLIKDLEKSSLIVAVLVIAAMAFYYQSLLGTFALILSLITGTLWTFGVSYFVVGYLNANSAFLGSIIMGNGINFGIVFLARYLEERSRGAPLASSLEEAILNSRKGTLIAALAAAMAYGSLMVTHFRGFRQFGVIGLIGMILCWITAYTLLPATLVALEKFRAFRPSRQRKGFAYFAAWITQKNPVLVLGASIMISVILVILASRHQGALIETDTSRLRDKKSMQSGSAYLSKYLDQIFGRYLSPLVLLPSTREKTLELTTRLKALIPSEKLISHVYSIDDFVPPHQNEKIKIMRDIRDQLTPGIMARLSAKDRASVKSFLIPENFRTFGIQDLPPMIQARFRENDGTVGKVVLVEPVFGDPALFQFDNEKRLIEKVRAVADSVEPGIPVVGQLPLLVDMIQSIDTDGPTATIIAFFSVILLVVLLFRSPVPIAQGLLALILGVFWTGCSALAIGLKINFMNFIALPITFGIGVDYGINLLTRYYLEGRGSIAHIVSTTGGAVALASLTTIIGYGSLLIAGNQGFLSFGKLAILGELSCISAAIFTLPALLQFLDQRRQKKSVPKAEINFKKAA